MRKTLFISVLLLLCLPLLACSGAESPPSDLPGESPDTNLPDASQTSSAAAESVQSSDTPVTSLDQIVGTWIAAADLGNFVATIFPDGTFSVATSLEDLESGSTDSWVLSIEEGQITATGFAMCLGDTGSYLAVLNEDGTLKFTSIIDPCEPRLRKMDRSLPGRLNPYNLIYNKVEGAQ